MEDRRGALKREEYAVVRGAVWRQAAKRGIAGPMVGRLVGSAVLGEPGAGLVAAGPGAVEATTSNTTLNRAVGTRDRLMAETAWRPGWLGEYLVESLILAQDQRWRRA